MQDRIGHGPFTRAMARASGFSDPHIRRRLRSGEWTVLRRGVYVDTLVLASADSQRRHALDVAGLLLALRFDAVAGGSSAAVIWGLDRLVEPASELVIVTEDATVPARSRTDYTVRTAFLPAHHRSVRYGVPITSPARTAVDLARTVGFADGVIAVDCLLRLGKASLPDLHRVLGDCFSWQGIGRAQRVVAAADPRSESALKSLSRVAMLATSLPMPRTQVVISDPRGPLARVDFLWEEFGVIGEADGLAKYEPDGVRTTRAIVRAEKRREEGLTDAGYEIVRWGWEDARNPRRLAHRLRAAFARGLQRQRGLRAG